ncbi:MAG: TlpA family protein disulfide reductase [Taibaiella sp.]|nr:TlpA family protein disulfide reductase [Taibaiella sp.]
MKNILLLLLVLPLFAVNSLYAVGGVKISGNITSPLSDSVTFTFNDNNLAYYPQIYYAKVSKTGVFTIEFPSPAGKYVQVEITHGNHLAELLLHAGDSLQLWVDTKHFDSSIRYAGRGADVQNFIAKHTIEKGRMNQYSIKLKTAINDTPGLFLKTIDAAYADEMKYLAQNIAKPPAAFHNWWDAFHKYYNYFFMQQYPQMHEVVRLHRFTDTIPAANYSVLKAMPDAFYDSLLQLPPYLLYLTGAVEARLKASGYAWHSNDTAGIRRMEDSVAAIVKKVMPRESAEFYMAQKLYGKARGQQLARTQAQLSDFKQRWPASAYLPFIERQVAMAERLAPGQPAPDFELVTNDGRRLKLSDLRGKVVYLNFWAGWCRQCVGEIMSEKKIKDLLRRRELEFVYVSIANDTALDMSLVRRYKITGIFANAAGGWASKEVQQYAVQSLPAYYLIDQQGKFVAQYTPGPAQALELVMLIEKLFK